MVQINWTKIALNDLKSIAEYISRDSSKYAKLQIIKLKLRVQILKSQPHIGNPVPEFPKTNFRQLVEGNYRLIYKIVSTTQIDVLTVHHTARDLTKRRIQKS